MTVLRIETTEIPAKIIKTSVIGIPIKEWVRMRRTLLLLGGVIFILILGLFLGGIFFLTAFGPIIITFWEAHLHTSQTLALLLSAIIGGIVFWFLFETLHKFGRFTESLQPNLIKKHGWDGESRYRVELESEQIVLHHDD